MRLSGHWRLFSTLVALPFFTACTYQAVTPKHYDASAQWLQSIQDYQYRLPPDHPDQSDKLLAISDGTKQQIHSLFANQSRTKAINQLARWLVSGQGHNMNYAVNANITPQQAFDSQYANCLSFTLLLVALAAELDIELDYNEVDQPFNLELTEGSYITFYRHINAVYQANQNRTVFDLTIDRYNAGHPQKIISRDQAIAMLHSNIGTDYLIAEDYENAYHKFKLAVSLSPHDASLWVNLGVLFKVDQQASEAEQLFLHALTLDPYNTIAANHLERLYASQGRHKMAQNYRKLAAKARLSNPYYHYEQAQQHHQNRQFSKAKQAIKRAIKLHDKDADFFEMASTIEQALKNYNVAIKHLEKAYKASHNMRDQRRYLLEIEKIIAKLNAQQRQNQTALIQTRSGSL